jgi:hypothetical protein
MSHTNNDEDVKIFDGLAVNAIQRTQMEGWCLMPSAILSNSPIEYAVSKASKPYLILE